VLDPDGTENILRVDQGTPGNDAVAVVPDLATLSALMPSTAQGGLGQFVDDDGFVASIASFVATSVGAQGPPPPPGGLLTWQDITEGPMPPAVLPNNGPAPTALPAGKWGQEKEVSRLDRFGETFYLGGTNFTDLYYPSSGLSVTSAAGVCDTGTCIKGNVGASCTTDGQCGQSINLDSSALSIGRGRRDIENLTQAANIDIPVIAFGGTNGLATVPAAYLGFAGSIAACAAPSCTGGTPRVVDPSLPNGLPDVRRRAGRLRGLHGGGLRPHRRADGRGQCGQPGAGGAGRLPRPQRAVSPITSDRARTCGRSDRRAA
jgi:hypothetical protein